MKARPYRIAWALPLVLAGTWSPALHAAEKAAVAAAAPGRDEVPYELWDRPRSGRAVLAAPAVREAIAALATHPSARLLILHPADSEGTLQAEELRAWLIAHAVAPARLELRAERSPRQPLALQILP